MPTHQTVVIGAGIAGLTAAIGLARLGHGVRVLERSTGVDANGAALGLWPAAQRGLEELGVFQRLAGEFVPYRHGVVRDRHGRHLAELPLARIERQAGRPVVLVGRPALMTALLDQWVEVSGGSIELNAQAPLEDILDHGADMVVGADGIRSSTRRYVAPAARPPRALHATAWRGSCEGTETRTGEIWGTGMFAGVTAGGPGSTNWYVAVKDGAGSAPASFEHLREILTGWPEPLGSVLARTKASAVLRHEIYDLPPLRSYVRGRVGLVGDAAHAMTPSLGQGACQAVLDSLALVRHLHDVEDVPTALRRYDLERRAAGSQFVRRSRALTRVQFAAPGLEDVRNRAIRTASRFAGVRASPTPAGARRSVSQ